MRLALRLTLKPPGRSPSRPDGGRGRFRPALAFELVPDALGPAPDPEAAGQVAVPRQPALQAVPHGPPDSREPGVDLRFRPDRALVRPLHGGDRQAALL